MRFIERHSALKVPRTSCALVFFGIDRRLDITGPSITKNILRPAEQLFDVESFGFLWGPNQVGSQGNGASARLHPPRISQLPSGTYQSAAQPDFSKSADFAQLQGFGDYWDNGFVSLANLYLQLMSLSRATEMAAQFDPEVVAFVRPDLLYHDSFHSVLALAKSTPEQRVLVPNWHSWNGLNDRFAVCSGRLAIAAYGNRIQQCLAFCEAGLGPLHSERLLKFALNNANMAVEGIGIRASRVRIDGKTKHENFEKTFPPSYLRKRVQSLRRSIRKRTIGESRPPLNY